MDFRKQNHIKCFKFIIKTPSMLFGIIGLVLATTSVFIVLILLINNRKQGKIIRKELKTLKELKDRF